MLKYYSIKISGDALVQKMGLQKDKGTCALILHPLRILQTTGNNQLTSSVLGLRRNDTGTRSAGRIEHEVLPVYSRTDVRSI